MAVAPLAACLPAEDDGAPLDSTRLQLRHLSEDDGALYLALYTDKEEMRYIGQPMGLGAARAAFYRCCELNRQCSKRYRAWVCLDTSLGAIVGFSVVQVKTGEAEVGTFVLPAWRRRGLGGEATLCVARHVLGWSGVEIVWTRHRPDNLGGAGLMAKLSFEQEDGMRADGMQYWCLRRDHAALEVFKNSPGTAGL
jgi:RimJ/RimL family protein N-acetyltransferase